MKIVTISQKMSGTGSIHNTASQHFDREIKFPSGHKYAVVLAAYYGNGKLYTTHHTEEAAIKESRRQREFSHERHGELLEPVQACFAGNLCQLQ